MTLSRLFICMCLTFGLAISATAQSAFAPIIKVNDRAITQYELDQRILFLTLLRSPGNLEELATEQLIDDRLRLDAIAAAGITLTDEQIEGGMAEFAGRANLELEQFLQALAQGGIDRATLREFVRAGLGWRRLSRARFAPRAQVTEAEIDRAIKAASSDGGIRVLLNEIILPNTPQTSAQTQRRVADIQRIDTVAGFQSAARQFSVSGSRSRSGQLDWLPLGNLPPQIRQIVLGLKPGEVSAPIPIPNAVIFFQLRDIEETEAAPIEYAAIEYAAYYIDGGRSEAGLAAAERVRAEVDTCDDLYGVAQGQPEEVLERGVLAPADIPQDIAVELAKLDEGEVSTALTRAGGQTLVFLMMCGRTPTLGEEVDRENVRSSLFNRRVESFANNYLAELRADAVIEYQ
ncbi:MAG: peptidylprolyl isomerase [Pseudomonadota bacterium]